MKIKLLTAAAAAVLLALGLLGLTANGATGQNDTVSACINSSHQFTHVSLNSVRSCPSQQPVSWPVSAGPAPSPSPSPTATPTPAPSPTSTASGSCVIHQGGVCGAYDYAPNAMSNGFNTYVMDQSVGPQPGSSSTVTVPEPFTGAFSSVQNDVPYGYGGVQIGLGVQQQLDDWCGTVTNWGSCPAPTDTPLASLNSLQINYSETSPQDANSIYEFAADAWPGNYGSDVMFWADTHGRCNEGSYGGTILGTANFDGQTWTVNRYGGPGAEIIFVLDSDPNTPNSCATQASGSIDVLAGLKWLVSNGYMSSLGSMGLLNAVWEITSADNTTFSMNSYSLTAS